MVIVLARKSVSNSERLTKASLTPLAYLLEEIETNEVSWNNRDQAFHIEGAILDRVGDQRSNNQNISESLEKPFDTPEC